LSGSVVGLYGFNPSHCTVECDIWQVVTHAHYGICGRYLFLIQSDSGVRW